MSPAGFLRALMGLLTLAAFGFCLPVMGVAQEPEELLEHLSQEEKLRLAEWIEAGEAAYDDGEFGIALEAYQEVYRLFPHPDVLYRLAVCHERVGDEEQAITYYRLFLAAVPRADERGRIERTIALLEDRIGAVDSFLRVLTTPNGASIYIDAEQHRTPVGESPARVSLAPGEYEIVIVKEGYEVLSERVEVLKGQTVVLRTTLVPVADGQASRSLWEPLVSLGLVGVGAWSAYRAVGHRNEGDRLEGAMRQWMAENPREGNEVEHRQRRDRIQQEETRAIAMGVLSGSTLLAAATLTAWWLFRADGEKGQVSLGPAGSGAGIGIYGRF